jgi:Uncharacterized conserved protein
MAMLVGTSGWQYDDWRGLLYPPGLPKRLWLERYGECFDTVENNNAFYRLPARETFESWRDRTPDAFVMAVKASRYLTHIKRLKDPREPVERLLRTAEGLGTKLGPILLQLPPTLRADTDLLTECLRGFPAGVRVAVEPRHPIVVDRPAPRRADPACGGVVLGGSVRPAQHPAVADRRLGISAMSRGCRTPMAQVR